MKKLIQNKRFMAIFSGTLVLLLIFACIFVDKNNPGVEKGEKDTKTAQYSKEDEKEDEMTEKDSTKEDGEGETKTEEETQESSEQLSESTSQEESEGQTEHASNGSVDVQTSEVIEQDTTSENTVSDSTKEPEISSEEETTMVNNNEKEPEVVESIFVHPGVLHSEEAFEYMKYAVDNSVSPNVGTWNVLLSTGFSDAYWYPRAVDTVVRGGAGDNISKLYIDVARAYQCALIWKISGSADHGMAACRILNAWSGTLKTVTGNADRYLAAGLFGYQLANVSEIMRNHPDFKLEQMQNMLYNVFYKPMNERFLIGNEYGYPHNDAYFQNYWANWDLCNMASAMAIGIFCDKEDAYNVAVDYFKNGIGNGSVYNAIPYVHEDGTAQWQESGRDQGHTNLGIGLMACICEMAWNQGDDLYGWADNRFLKAAEYVAKYNNGEDVSFSEYEWGSGRNGTVNYHTVVSASGRGEVRPIWSMIYNHYVNRKGLQAPNVKARLDQFGWAEYGAGGHATTFDQPGWGTLTFAGNIGKNNAALPEGNIIEGKYRIVSVHTGKSLKVCDDNVIRQCIKGSDARDVWEIIDLCGGEYKIKNVETGLVMAISGDSHANAAWVIAYDDNGKASQRFAFLTADVGNYRIIASNSGKALDIPWGSDDETLNLQQYRYTLLNFQKWYLEPVN